MRGSTPELVERVRENRRRHGSRYGLMRVIDSGKGFHRIYLCPCGWTGASAWGHAEHHGATCPRARGIEEETR